MWLSDFVTCLWDNGKVRTSSDELSAADKTAAVELLADFERLGRLEFPTDPPTFSADVALWAANVLYDACHFVVHRDDDEHHLRTALSLSCPESSNAGTHYSADLIFRFLPDVIRLARVASQNDPLVGELVKLANQWPLSSVGVPGLREIDDNVILSCPCLARVYIDRMIDRNDLSRLANPRVRSLVAEALGMYDELAPEIAREIRRLDESVSHYEPGTQQIDL